MTAFFEASRLSPSTFDVAFPRVVRCGARLAMGPRPKMRDRLPVVPEERAPLLDARREAKMTSSAHAYVRGSTKHFYEWLSSARGRSLPDGPSIWIGGDCHIGNLGPLAGKDGSIQVELRDLDQTVVGSPAHDVVRLALSMAMAVRASDLPGAVTAKVLENIAQGYEAALERKAANLEETTEAPPAPVLEVLRQARGRSRRSLFDERLGKGVGKIPVGKRYWPLLSEERAAVEKLVETVKVRKLVTGLASRDDDAEVVLVDAAYWVKGCSSLGLWRAAAVVRIRGKKDKASSHALLDIKEAIAPLAPRSSKVKMPTHHGERVVSGARALSPSFGERMVAASLLSRDVFVRELLPQDLKFELDKLTEADATAVGHYLGGVVANAHARQLKAEEASSWLTSFRKGSAKNLDAPAWLWAAVVDLVALHEGAYLEHCREHALPPTQALANAAAEITSHHVTGD